MAIKGERHTRIVRAVVALGLLLVFLASLEVFSRFFLEASVPEGVRQEVQINIPTGASIDEIAGILDQAGLIEHPRLFRFAVQLLGADTKIQAGTIRLASGQSLFELIGSLSRAKAVGFPVTIREGLTSMQVASLLAKKVGLDSAQVMSLVKDTAFVHSLGLDAPTLEGYLFPDTYFLNSGMNTRDILSRMVSNFKVKLPDDFESRAASVNMTMNEVLTLASIVEWEVLIRREAPIVASVYMNRIKRGMPLQADPTIAYALGKGPSRLYYSDLAIVSPYNTYLNPGLPPGAINNPGLKSIEAVLNPATTSYLYFVAQGDGTHAFTSTLDDHLIAKQKLDQIRREQKLKSDSNVNG